MRFYPLALFVAALLPVSVLAERYGSETTVTLQGTYYISGATSTQTLPNGDTRDTSTHNLIQINNNTVLQAMSSRSLIAGAKGYRLVMVARAHMADGVSWFATKATGTPVAVPADLLTLDVSDGPTSGQLVVDGNDVLKSLSQQTHNQAGLILANFTGSGLLTQTWSAKPVKNGTATEVVELVSSTGTFTGAVTASPNSGVGSIILKLAGAKTVDLTRYGMVTTNNSGSSGSVVVNGSNSGNTTAGTLTLAGSGSFSGATTVSGGLIKLGTGTLTLSGSNTNTGTTTSNTGAIDLSSVNFTSSSTLTLNATQGSNVLGLTLDANGIPTSLPLFGSSLPGTLILTTTGGSFTYDTSTSGSGSMINLISLTLAGSNTYTGSTIISSGSLSGINSPINLIISSSTINLSSSTLSGTITINTTTGGGATGLVVDADGNVTQFPTFGTSLPGTLVIITSSGPHTYTHDANGVWTLVTP